MKGKGMKIVDTRWILKATKLSDKRMNHREGTPRFVMDASYTLDPLKANSFKTKKEARQASLPRLEVPVKLVTILED
jgi:hypothetical protein